MQNAGVKHPDRFPKRYSMPSGISGAAQGRQADEYQQEWGPASEAMAMGTREEASSNEDGGPITINQTISDDINNHAAAQQLAAPLETVNNMADAQLVNEDLTPEKEYELVPIKG